MNDILVPIVLNMPFHAATSEVLKEKRRQLRVLPRGLSRSRSCMSTPSRVRIL